MTFCLPLLICPIFTNNFCLCINVFGSRGKWLAEGMSWKKPNLKFFVVSIILHIMVTWNGAVIIWLVIDLSWHTQFYSKWYKWRCQQIHYLMSFLENYIPLVNVFVRFTRISGIQKVFVKPGVFLEGWWGVLKSSCRIANWMGSWRMHI